MHLLEIIRRHPSSSITAFFAAIALLPPFVGQFRDAAAPFGVPDAFWLKLSAVLAGAIVVGQMWQRVAPSAANFGWTVPKVFGFLAALAAGIQPLLGDLRGTLEPFGIDNEVWLEIGGGLTLVTLAGAVIQTVMPGNKVTRPPLQ